MIDDAVETKEDLIFLGVVVYIVETGGVQFPLYLILFIHDREMYCESCGEVLIISSQPHFSHSP